MYRQPQVTTIDELVRAASKRYGVSSKDLDMHLQISSLSTSCALIPATPLAARRASAPFIGTDAIFLLICEACMEECPVCPVIETRATR